MSRGVRDDIDKLRAREKAPVVHGMIPGSHEHGGAECRCGAPWSRWDDMCLVQFKAKEKP